MFAERGGEMPKKTLKRFLAEEARLEKLHLKQLRENLSKFTKKDSPFFKDIFAQENDVKIQEKIQRTEQPNSNETAIVTQNCVDPNVFKKYTLIKMDGKWLISDVALRCALCKGSGCEHCEKGWLR
jgi:hypothetical protein